MVKNRPESREENTVNAISTGFNLFYIFFHSCMDERMNLLQFISFVKAEIHRNLKTIE